MPAKLKRNFFTNWTNYLRLLWVASAIFALYIVFGYIAVSRDIKENPAGGLATVGVIYYFIILLLLLGFIGINYIVRKKIASNKRVSDHFLIASWLSIAVICVGALLLSYVSHMNQSYYEQNVAPKLDRCYQEYLAGKGSTPYEDCIDSSTKRL